MLAVATEECVVNAIDGELSGDICPSVSGFKSPHSEL